MATGALSSAQTQAAAAAPLRAGERQATTASALKDPKAKTYHHRFPGAQFIMPDGLALVFLGGTYTTAKPEEIAQLDAVADRPSSMIYIHKEAAEAAASVETKAADDARVLSNTGTDAAK